MKIAALFPGQNSHALGMGQATAAAFGVAQDVMQQTETLLPGLSALMKEGPLEELTLTANQQPALVAASVAVYRAWQQETGLTPAYAAGHSLGEYSAHVAAGTLSLPDALRLTRKRGELMQAAVPVGVGAMSAVMGDPAAVREVCGQVQASGVGVVEIANLNAPTQTVISGDKAAVDAAASALKALGLKAIPLKVSAPFHCSLMEPAREGLLPDLTAAEYSPMLFPVVANVSAQPVSDAGQVAALLAQQITGSVRWVESIQQLAALGVDTFVEFGNGTVLTGLVKRILPEARTYNVHTPDDIAAFGTAGLGE
ncbi:ACP S-malonyltransferase [Deinococcus ruber]|uniref:Malonyl CoA-acyl carrier protein transacylase n=1 Tax=Deinococcus ruber TaxID=1848197 RepID=A0A918F7F1_9DEIO|nr:ACP S-malonyltransferase [Deinococcus ruber]GGR12452.1 malonyl CoA-acyl carrier protein transacylase [Deinococcus ruber]